jgi:seryl-tRNA synthetase
LENNQFLEKLVKVEESTKSAHHRIDTLEQKQEKDSELIIAVKELAVEMKNMRKDMTDIDGRLKQIESKPGKRLEQIISLIVTGIGTAILGFLIAKLGL